MRIVHDRGVKGATRTINHIAFQHGQHHGNHILLQIEQLLEQIHLARVLGQLVLHVREQEKETANCIPQTGMGQCLLIERAWTLNDLSECVEDLTGHTDCLEEVRLARRIDDLLARIVPIEIHNRFLQTQQIIHRANDHIYSGCVARLGAQIVLPFCEGWEGGTQLDSFGFVPCQSAPRLTQIVTLAGELNETEERTRELRIMHVLLTRRTLRADPETCTRTWNILFVVLLQNIWCVVVVVGGLLTTIAGEHKAHSNKSYGIDDSKTCV